MDSFVQIPTPFPIVHMSTIDQEFRRWLQDRGFWSFKVDRLFVYFVHQPQMPRPISEEQQQLLAQVVEDARNGINITERYPAFFRDLLQQAELRREFMTAADIKSESIG